MFRRSTLFSLLVLAFFVMAGLQILWFLALVIGQKTVSSLVAVNPGQLLVDPSGRLVFEQFDDGEARYRTTDGKPIVVPDENYWLDGVGLAAPLGERGRNRRLGWSERLSGQTEFTRPPVSWYLVHTEISDGQGYLVGYNEVSKAQVGYLGREGFRTTLPPSDQWFSIVGPSTRQFARQSTSFRQASGKTTFSGPTDRRGGSYLVSGGAVWRLDLASRSAEVLFPSTNAASVSPTPIVKQAPAGEVPADWTGGPFYVLSGAGLLVRTPTRVLGVDFQGRQRTSWTIPEKLRGSDFTWYELADGTALVAELRTDADAETYWMEYHWVDKEGNIVREEEVRFEPKPAASKKYWTMAAVVPQTFFMTLMSDVALPYLAVEQGLQTDFATAVAQSLADGWMAMLAVCLLSAALACLAYRRQTRFALPGPVAWAFFVFLFGLPGWLAYRWHRRWPVLEACGECRQPAPRDRETCAACGRIFAAPPPVGTEIFA